eukprot:TRINITY_DN20655_c0_g1_i1.p1 TRINITY_DN20655_c0_g1~~TRINITY_DN20655_c0_g1_i1.p1  ORF type:complete len:169 (+),score=24.09 TRINITY_DN20655_c0_g1_i1:82-588(+)
MTSELSYFLPQLLPMLPWVEIHRTCLAQKECSRNLLKAVHSRYLSDASTGVRARVDKLGKQLSGAQAAQARGSPEALTVAATDIMCLQQCTQILGENCEKYADLMERVGFTLGDDLDAVADALLHSLDKLQSFQDAVVRLRQVAESTPLPGIACRDQSSPQIDTFDSD